MTLHYEVRAATHRGYHRAHNEDRIAVDDWASSATSSVPIVFHKSDCEPLICMVADGMGGHAGGRLASRIAVQKSRKKLIKAASPEAVAETLEEVNQDMFSSMDEGTQGMGATVAGVRIHLGNAFAFNVGDSRVYIFEGDKLKQLSIDDSFKDSRSNRKLSSAITQSLGGGFRRRRIDPHVVEKKLFTLQKILICSDGLTDLVEDNELEEVMKIFPHNDVSRLLGLALDKGGTDNISIISIHVA